ncbi:hypothetical protein ACFL5X_04285, partial [Candidatus Omnitrophota bacterium]
MKKRKKPSVRKDAAPTKAKFTKRKATLAPLKKKTITRRAKTALLSPKHSSRIARPPEIVLDTATSS